ncbi:MAG: hypothetical protein JWM74_3760, partial [Myxococcaceae bacterium]|nr:hypothetical protein [Myxococcaceae bacterium]
GAAKPREVLPGVDGPPRPNLGARLKPAEIEALARALRKHCSVFSWRRGDVLLSDNLQMLHAGMPGAGPRELRVILCNPISMTKSDIAPVVQDGDTVEPYESIDARIRRYAATSS